MNIDQIYKAFLMEEAKKRFEQMSQVVIEALCEEDKTITIRQYDPERLKERIGRN